MKTKKEILKEKFNGAHPSHYLGLIRTEWKMEAIYSAMEDYAQMKVNELNKSDVIKSVCECKEMNINKYYGDYCERCGKDIKSNEQTVL